MQVTFKGVGRSVALAACAVLLSSAAQSKAVSGKGTWETTLKGRDIDGKPVSQLSKQAVFLYDTELDVTWLRDAEHGWMQWDQARDWATGLSVGGFSDWRLPTVVDTGRPGCDYSYSGTDCGYNVQTKSGSVVYSEMAYLFYATLGNRAYVDVDGTPHPIGYGLTNSGSFKGLQPSNYWSGNPLGAGQAWEFNFDDGSQAAIGTGNAQWAMALRAGDVAPVPEPQTLVLMLAGMIALAAVRRRAR